MKKRTIKKLVCLACVILLILSVSGCSLNSYSVDKLKELYPKAIENSLNEELYYWKETVNASDHTSWRTCNVYAEMDKKFNVIRDENGECSNMKVDVFEEYNKKSVYKALCGKSESSSGDDVKSYLFENDFDDSGNASNYRKTEMSPQSFIAGNDFKAKYSLDALLEELEYLSVDDMIFDIDNSLMEHSGKVVKLSFAVKDDYTDRYKTESGKASIFEGAKYATIELSYDRFASIVVYAEEKLGKNISADKEIYKLETVYYGPKIDIPSYDSGVWAEAAK